MPKEKDWYNIFTADQASNKYQNWLSQAIENRQLADLSLAPFERHDGLIRDKRDWLKSTSVRKIMRNVKSRILVNPIVPKAVPHEGEVNEEDMTKICDALWSHESFVERGPKNLMLDAEISDWIDEVLETGMGYLDLRIDAALRTPTFYNGVPIYESLNSVNVVLDAAARRLKEIRHLHIISVYEEDDFEIIFDVKADGFKSKSTQLQSFAPILSKGADWKIGDINAGGNLDGIISGVEVIETQFIKYAKDELVEIPTSLQRAFFLNLDPPGLMFREDLKLHLKKLEKSIPGFKAPPINSVIKGLRRGEQLRWGVYSTFYVGNSKIHDGKEYYVGGKFTVVPMSFLRISQDSPYAWGAPYFLRDLQKMEVLVNTKLSELVMKSNKKRMFTKMELQQDTKDAIADPLKDIVELKEFAGDPRPLSELIHFEDASDVIPFLIQFRASIGMMLDEEFGTGGQHGQELPYKGAPAKLVNTLVAVGSVMVSSLRESLERNLGKVYERVRNLAVYALPRQALITIAAENDEGRKALIMSGDFYKRIGSLNTLVKLDLTTEQEKLFLKQIYSRLFEVGKLDELTYFELMGVPEPKRLAQAVQAQMMATNQALAYGTFVTQDPDARQTYMPAIQNSMKIKETLNQRTAGNTQTRQRG